MKKLLLSAALVAFAIPGVAAATHTPASSGPHDKAVGALKVTTHSGSFKHVRVSAHSGPAGENPNGQIHVTFQGVFAPAGDVKGRVVCLQVSGNVARVAALLDQPFEGATHVTLIITDLGEPQQGQSPDLVTTGFTSAPPAHCASGGVTLVASNTSGNLVVHDGS